MLDKNVSWYMSVGQKNRGVPKGVTGFFSFNQNGCNPKAYYLCSFLHDLIIGY